MTGPWLPSRTSTSVYPHGCLRPSVHSWGHQSPWKCFGRPWDGFVAEADLPLAIAVGFWGTGAVGRIRPGFSSKRALMSIPLPWGAEDFIQGPSCHLSWQGLPGWRLLCACHRLTGTLAKILTKTLTPSGGFQRTCPAGRGLAQSPALKHFVTECSWPLSPASHTVLGPKVDSQLQQSKKVLPYPGAASLLSPLNPFLGSSCQAGS